jgi:hypothetical protein
MSPGGGGMLASRENCGGDGYTADVCLDIRGRVLLAS